MELTTLFTGYDAANWLFAGETADGEKVNVSIGHALLMAYIERDKVRGMALRTLKAVK